MPYITIKDTQIFYEQSGVGPEIILFAHGLLWSHKMFAQQIKVLKERYTCIAYDHRGQGSSEVGTREISMDSLTEDALELIDQLAGQPVHFVGLSMGGFLGMRLAARHTDKIKSLTLIETSAQKEPTENLSRYKLLNSVVKVAGISVVASKVMEILFSQSWLKDPENKEAYDYWLAELKSNPKSITKSVEAVIFRDGVEEELPKISCPTLILVGDEDIATTPEKAQFIHERIEHSILKLIGKAGHSSSIEQGEIVTDLLAQFLENCAK